MMLSGVSVGAAFFFGGSPAMIVIVPALLISMRGFGTPAVIAARMARTASLFVKLGGLRGIADVLLPAASLGENI
jgi:hypothetical protein